MKLRRSSTRANNAVVAILVACATSASAAPTVIIVLVGDATPAFERELSAEAKEVGLTVAKGDRQEDPEQALLAHDAVAVLRVVPPARVEVWFKKSGDHGNVAPHELLTGTGDASEPFAARVIEQVRAHLVKLALLPEPESSGQAPASAPVQTVAPAPGAHDSTRDGPKAEAGAARRLLWAEAGVGGMIATGGVPGTVQALVGMRATPGRFEVGAFGLLPLSNGDVAAKEGSAEVAPTLIGAHLDYVLSDERAPLRGVLGVGGGALLLSMRGQAVSPYSGHDESLITAAFFVDGSVRQQVTGWLGLRLSALIGTCAPQPVVAFSGRDVATWGRAFGTLVASVELGAPIPAGAP